MTTQHENYLVNVQDAELNAVLDSMEELDLIKDNGLRRKTFFFLRSIPLVKEWFIVTITDKIDKHSLVFQLRSDGTLNALPMGVFARLSEFVRLTRFTDVPYMNTGLLEETVEWIINMNGKVLTETEFNTLVSDMNIKRS